MTRWGLSPLARTPPARYLLPSARGMIPSNGSTLETLRDQYEAQVRGSMPRPNTVAELVAAYLSFCREHYPARIGKRSSSFTNARDAARSIETMYGPLALDAVGPIQVQAARLFLIDQQLSRRTINDRIARIRRMYRWAMERGWVGSEVVEGLCINGLRKGRSKAKETPLKRAVPIETVLRTIRDPRMSKAVKDMVRVQLRTGMRPAEITELRGSEIDTTDHLRWFYEPAEHKMAYLELRRVVLIGPRAQLILMGYMREGFLFLTRRGKPYKVDSYRQEIVRACQRQGIPPWCPLQLRKRTATEAAKVSETAARDVLGHADVKTTRQHYIDARHSADAARFATDFG